MPAPKPTILQIIPRLDTGGAELSTLEIVEAIVRAGGRALVATEGGRLAPEIAALGGEFIAFDAATKNPLRMSVNAQRLTRLIGERGIDLLHARSRAPAWSALVAARRAGVPLVTTYHGAYSETNALKRVYNSVMVRGDIVIANSHYTAGLIRDRYATGHERIRVIHRGIDCTRFDPAAIAPVRIAALRQSWGLDGSERVILNPARLTEWKGQATLIDAAGILQSRGRLEGAIVILAGDAQGRGAYLEGLRARISGLGLHRTVRLVGHVADIPAACALAHVTVVASIEPEAFGRVAIEAQAMGSPIVATNIGAPPESVLAEPSCPSESATGWLVPPADADALANGLAAALGLQPEARAAMGQRARANVAARFTLDSMMRQTLVVYDGLLGSDMSARFVSTTGGGPGIAKAGSPS